jgi:hypothetical protein
MSEKRTPLFDADGVINRVPDRQVFDELASVDPIVQQARTLHLLGELTYEQALLLAVVSLQRQAKRAIDEAVRLTMLIPFTVKKE